jgi:hypothetical protein
MGSFYESWHRRRERPEDFAYGFGRVMFPFFAGVLLYRFKFPQRAAPYVSVGTLLALPVLLLAPVHEVGVASLLYVLLLFPLIVATGAAVDVSPLLAEHAASPERYRNPFTFCKSQPCGSERNY